MEVDVTYRQLSTAIFLHFKKINEYALECVNNINIIERHFQAFNRKLQANLNSNQQFHHALF